MRGIDRLTVHLQPVADLQQAFFHDWRNHAVSPGADVKQQIAAAAEDVHQHQYQFTAGVVVLDSLGSIVAVAHAHAAALFPGVRGSGHSGRVLGGPVAAVLVARVASPSIVDHNFVLHRRFVVEPGQQLGAAPLLRGHFPLAIAEDDSWLVAGDDILELWHHVLGHVARFVAEIERVVPLVERVIDAHP